MGVLIGGAIRSASTHSGLWPATACITGTLHCYSTDGNGVWNDLSDGGAYAYDGVSVTYAAGGFYSATVNMTSADIKYYPDLNINGYWKVVELAPMPQSATCFTAQTEISMADGSVRAIVDVQVGDLVVGRHGALNCVVGLDRPLLGDRELYAIDGGEPFVTGEHPLLTTAGWTAVDPAATAAENPTLPVTRLAPGASLIRVLDVRVLAGAGIGAVGREVVTLHTAVLPLRTLESHIASPSTQLYNLLLDGDHTYVANGFVAHNKTSTH